MASFDKAGYKQFETEALAAYTPAWWNKGAVDAQSVAAPANTSTVPTDGAPAYVIKTGKKVVCADFYLPDNSAHTIWERAADPTISSQMQAKLTKCKLNLYHAGNARNAKTPEAAMGKVTFGWDAGDSVLKLPATDSGGLTNVKLEFVNTPMNFNTLIADGYETTFDQAVTPARISATSSAAELAAASAATLTEWTANTQMLAEMDQAMLSANLQKWVASVSDYLKNNGFGITEAALRIATFPSESRVLVSRADVEAKCGKYMVRTWSDGDDYATTPPVDAAAPLFLAVVPYNPRAPDGFITPNINMKNIRNEYVPMFS